MKKAIPAVLSLLAFASPAVAAVKAKVRTVTGPSVGMQLGPIQVTLKVKGKKIVNVLASYPTERPRSQFINSQAIPMLRQEVLQLQSANIQLIGGATMTSEAYAVSLQAAIDKAKI